MADNNQPNLTTEPLGGTLAEGKFQRYKSITECSEARNIPKAVLSLAKKQNAPGFNQNGSIHWEDLQPYLQQNYRALATEAAPVIAASDDRLADRREKLELEKLAEEVKKLRNVNKKNESEFINRKLVLKTVRQIANNTSSVLRRWLEHEQPAQCEGMSLIQLKQANIKILESILTELRKPISTYQNYEDLNDTSETTVQPVEQGEGAVNENG